MIAFLETVPSIYVHREWKPPMAASHLVPALESGQLVEPILEGGSAVGDRLLAVEVP